jgi:hypothetical protein
MKLAIMQPYFFPYIGYFQLINAVDKFVFYDDVNFIKNGWINRNRILVNGKPNYLTVQLKNASSYKLINEIEFSDNRIKLIKQIQQSYAKAPFIKEVLPVLTDILTFKTNKISELAQKSVIDVCRYLEIKTVFEVSSEIYTQTKGMDKAERLIQICQLNNIKQYYNVMGGIDLYSRDYFKKNGIELFFIESLSEPYKQYSTEFIPYLSILDVMMFNSVEEIHRMLNNFELI